MSLCTAETDFSFVVWQFGRCSHSIKKDQKNPIRIFPVCLNIFIELSGYNYIRRTSYHKHLAKTKKCRSICLPRHFYNHSDVLYLFIYFICMLKTSSQQTVTIHNRFNSFKKSCNQYKDFHSNYSS